MGSTPGVSCLLSYLLSVVSILETISLSPAASANRSGPISRAEQSGAEIQSTRFKGHSRPHGQLSRVAGLNSQLGLQVGGHGYSRNSTRSGSIAHLNQSPTHCHPHLVSPWFPICCRSRLFSLLLFPLLVAPVTSHNPQSRQLASGCAALYMQTDRA